MNSGFVKADISRALCRWDLQDRGYVRKNRKSLRVRFLGGRTAAKVKTHRRSIFVPLNKLSGRLDRLLCRSSLRVWHSSPENVSVRPRPVGENHVPHRPNTSGQRTGTERRTDRAVSSPQKSRIECLGKQNTVGTRSQPRLLPVMFMPPWPWRGHTNPYQAKLTACFIDQSFSTNQPPFQTTYGNY